MTKIAPVAVESKRSPSAQEQQAARAEKATQVSKQKARRRRGVRLSFFVLVVLLLAAVWSLIALPGTHTTVAKAYDPAAGLSIETFGCDIDFVAGDAARLEYRAIWAASDFQFENSADDASITEVVTASNRMGCAAEWKKACRRVCLLTVTVPASAAGAFNVKQAEGAEGEEAPWPLLTVRAGASVASIKVGDWWAYQPTISAHVDHATVGSFTWRAKDGDFTSVNSTITSANLYARGAGSIHLLGVEASGVDVPVHWRQPDHRFCASTDLRPAAASFVEGGAWDLCDISTVIDGSDLTTNWGTYSKLRDQQRSYLPLRGALVLVGDGFADQWGNMDLLEIDDDGGFRRWENPYVRDTLRASITLSAVVGGLLGVIFVASMYTVLAKIQHQRHVTPDLTPHIPHTPLRCSRKSSTRRTTRSSPTARWRSRRWG